MMPKVFIFLDNFAHRCVPKHVIECFPNLTVLKLGKSKSEFLKLYFLLLRLNRSHRELVAILSFTLHISVSISCGLLFSRDGRFALTNSCSYVDVLLRKTVRRAFSCIRSSFLLSDAFAKCQIFDNMLSVVILKTYRILIWLVQVLFSSFALIHRLIDSPFDIVDWCFLRNLVDCQWSHPRASIYQNDQRFHFHIGYR